MVFFCKWIWIWKCTRLVIFFLSLMWHHFLYNDLHSFSHNMPDVDALDIWDLISWNRLADCDGLVMQTVSSKKQNCLAVLSYTARVNCSILTSPSPSTTPSTHHLEYAWSEVWTVHIITQLTTVHNTCSAQRIRIISLADALSDELKWSNIQTASIRRL